MDSIINQKPIKVFNYGKLSRDFTYIDDIIEGLSVIINHEPAGEIPYKIYNIGAGKPIPLLGFIAAIEKATGKTAIKQMVGMQPGDVYQTYADTTALEQELHFKPHISIQKGINRLYGWYRTYFDAPNLKTACNYLV